MKKITTTIVICVFLMAVPQPARADLFGGDVAVLSQILVQAILQFAKLREILSKGQESIDLVKDINRGINDSLGILKTQYPNLDPGIYSDWSNSEDALAKLQSIYGNPADSQEAQVQRDTDRSIAEAVSFNNSYYKYAKALDEVGEDIKGASHSVSPGGAQKLTAQALGLMLQVMNQSLRAQATTMKLQAEELALQNKKEKAETKHFLETGDNLTNAMKREVISFEMPRY